MKLENFADKIYNNNNNNNNNNNFIYVSIRFSIAANCGHLKRVTIIRIMYQLNF